MTARQGGHDEELRGPGPGRVALALSFSRLVELLDAQTEASSVCFGVDGALIALYGVFLGAGPGARARGIPETPLEMKSSYRFGFGMSLSAVGEQPEVRSEVEDSGVRRFLLDAWARPASKTICRQHEK